MDDLFADCATELEARVTSFVTEHRLPGAMAGLVTGDGLAWSAGVGFADVAARRAPDPATIYRIASITKTFTATAIMRLAGDGRLHLHDPAVEYLPELRQASSPFGPVETVTIRRLLAHQSGLQVDPPGTDLSVPDDPAMAYEGLVERTLARAAEIAVRVPPDTDHKYSNLGYQLLGEIVARVTGTPYQEHVRETILVPLGMTATSFEPLPEALAGRRATGYAGRLFSDQLDTAAPFPPFWSEGGLWSCLDDLARWVSFQLSAYADPPPASPVLDAAALRALHKPHYLADGSWAEARGLGWFASRREVMVLGAVTDSAPRSGAESVTFIQHSGGLPGYLSNACFDPESRVGAIVLLNGSADPVPLALDLAGIGRRAVRARPAAIEPPAPVPDGWRPLLGLYGTPAGPDAVDRVVRLEWRDGKLTFTDPADAAWRPVLEPTGDRDVFIVGPGYRQSGEQVTFRRPGDGPPDSAFFAEFTLVRLDRTGT